ncbi:glutathione S-transferase [Chromohalobacter canadensis]|uniref:Glutathione S-transferase n=1 Tax=Chromohalobacter canadensis TaxID=141389 RepID=A0A285VKW1_9GAMM|nr:glutathione transferase GstA [Chromohalobacter canadensis]SOC54720.1 glutathione S-transferase [Chromohalobacter canadensis]
MKLYLKPGSCAMAVHIALEEAELTYEIEKVDLAAKKTESGEDYLAISPNGYVPALVLEDGEVMTEAAAILLYIANLAPEAELAPAPGSKAYFELLSQLVFISTELHKNFSPFFKPNSGDTWRGIAQKNLETRLSLMNERLTSNDYVMGERFSVADAYLFTVLSWAQVVDISLDAWPHLQRFVARIAERDSVQRAMQAEGLK